MLNIGDYRGDNVGVEVNDQTQEVREQMNNAIAKALEEVGITAEAYAKLLCPVDTGRLRNSISHAIDENTKTVYIGTNVEYAPYVEMGTSKTKAQPFLEPAITNHVDEYRTIFYDQLKGN
jgi:HK97 gp10 family phage protein